MEQFLGLPPDGSAHGPAIDGLIVLVHWLMIVLFIGWGTFYVTTLIRFRKSKNPKANYGGVKSHFSTYAEAGVLLVEISLLVLFSIPLWSKRVDAFPAENEATVVRIVAEQFAWNVHYPGKDGIFGRTSISLIDADNPLGIDRTDPNAKDDFTTINQLNLPVDKPVLIRLTTKDVIHSLNLPAFRVKQDAIPGMLIPVWFTPVKTTDQIREEMRRPFSVASAAKRIKKVTLPTTSMMTIVKGASRSGEMAMQDYTDTTGVTVVAKGDMLTGETVEKLTTAGIKEVASRSMAKMENYFSMEDVTTPSGEQIVAKNDALTEDNVTKLVAAGIKEVTARAGSNMDIFVLMEDVSAKSGTQIAAKGDALGEDVITKLSEAGIDQIVVAPATPTEIACAQLCGLGHYRMRGYVTVQTQDAFTQWYNDQEAAVLAQFAPPPADSSGAVAPADTTSATRESAH